MSWVGHVARLWNTGNYFNILFEQSGSIPPFPQYAFVALCSVKAQGQIYYLLELRRFWRVRHRLFNSCVILMILFQLQKLYGVD